MTITYLTQPNQNYDYVGIPDGIVVALASGDTMVNTVYSPQTTDETAYMEGPNQTFTAISARNAVDHVGVYGTGDTINITSGNVDYWGDGGTVISSGFRTADSQYSMGGTDIVAHGTGSLYAVAHGSLDMTGAPAGTPPVNFGGRMSFLGDAGYYVIDGRDASNTSIDFGKGGGVAAGGNEQAPYTPGNAWIGNSTLKAGTGDMGSRFYGAAHGNNTLIDTGHAGTGMEGGQFANNVLDASQSTGADWLEGYQGNASLGAGNTRILGGAGSDIIVSGAGSDTMIAGTGQDNFLIFNDAAQQVAGGNRELVVGFKQGTDHVGLWGFTGSTDAILATAQHFGGDTILRLQDGLQLTVAGVNLTAADVWRAG